MAAPKTIAEPEKELRFTRSGQGVRFAIGAAIAYAAVIILVVAFVLNRELWPIFLWALIPLAAGCILTWLAVRCTRHAYIILSPLGIEIFPFFKPQEGLQVIYWSEINYAEVTDDHRLIQIHRDAARTSGVIASLHPIRPDRRTLLATAVAGTMQRRKHNSSANPQSEN